METSNLLFLIPALPLGSAFLLGLYGRRLSQSTLAQLGSGSVGLSAILTWVLGAQLLTSPQKVPSYRQTLWTWIQTEHFHSSVTFQLDALSLVMTGVITTVGFLIHLYSIEFMKGEDGYSRFFASMNLFVASMLTLILADNLLLLYLGWEGVGLCSYLLIGFWYREPANGRAGQKAFIVTRVGDTALAIGLLLLFLHFGTLEVQPLLRKAQSSWLPGSSLATWIALLILGGAIGKSAQIPLQVWLPDAMAGPTPVSALIHAATMVTAGVYLIARTHTFFELAPGVQSGVAMIGAATLLLAAISALTQTDIKRVLAYSTISQIGYMFLALGVGAWSSAVFHLLTHAFFKALLFLSAGAVILSLHHEHDIRKMGGLRKQMPLVFWTFLIGAASLSAIPFITAGFYSKDSILAEVYLSPQGSFWLWIVGILGAFLTSLYSFRLVFLVFFGTSHQNIPANHLNASPVPASPGALISIPLVALSLGSTFGGFMDLPPSFGGHAYLSHILQNVFSTPRGSPMTSATTMAHLTGTPEWVSIVASVASIAGAGTAYTLYLRRPEILSRIRSVKTLSALQRLGYSGWRFDQFYERFLVRPFLKLAWLNQDDRVDLIFDGISRLSFLVHRIFSKIQTGQLRWYAAVLSGGAVLLVMVTLWVTLGVTFRFTVRLLGAS